MGLNQTNYCKRSDPLTSLKKKKEEEAARGNSQRASLCATIAWKLQEFSRLEYVFFLPLGKRFNYVSGPVTST